MVYIIKLLSLLFLSQRWKSSSAWIPSKTPKSDKKCSRYAQHSQHQEDIDLKESNIISQKESSIKELLLPSAPSDRREWFQEITARFMATAAAGVGTSLLPIIASKDAHAAGAPDRLKKIVTSEAICDPTVSVWKKTDNNRLVFLLGTAHISQVSSELAGRLVRDVHPTAVFVELDLKRVAGQGRISASLPPPVAASNPTTDKVQADTVLNVATTPPPLQVVIPQPILAEPSMGTTNEVLPATKKLKPNWFQRGFVNFAATAVGNAVRGMYSNMDAAGFNPGQEFVEAIRAGQEIGAAIVLGDQDVEITLRRLTQALAVTDLTQLLSPDAPFEKSMAELLPPAAETMPTADKTGSTAQFKQEMSEYVERLKSRESVRKIMTELNEVAPALVQVMLKERDAYMAAGIDTLNQFESIVAVMGIAHQDGVELNLRDRGWIQVRLQCP